MSAAVPHFGIAIAVHLGGTPSLIITFLTVFNALVICGAIISERKHTIFPRSCGATGTIVAGFSVTAILSLA